MRATRCLCRFGNQLLAWGDVYRPRHRWQSVGAAPHLHAAGTLRCIPANKQQKATVAEVMEEIAQLPTRSKHDEGLNWPYLEINIEEKQPEPSLMHDVMEAWPTRRCYSAAWCVCANKLTRRKTRLPWDFGRGYAKHQSAETGVRPLPRTLRRGYARTAD